MRVLYFDCCKQDCAEFSRFFYDVQSQRPVLRDTELICGSLEVMEPIRRGVAFDVGFIDFFVADAFCSDSVRVAEELYEMVPTAHLYGLLPIAEKSCDVSDLMRTGILQPEVLYKNTPFLNQSIEEIIFAKARELSELNFGSKLRTVARRLRLV